MADDACGTIAPPSESEVSTGSLSIDYDKTTKLLRNSDPTWRTLADDFLVPFLLGNPALLLLYAATRADYDLYSRFLRGLRDQPRLNEDDTANLRAIIEAARQAGAAELELEVEKDGFAGLKLIAAEPKSGIRLEGGAGLSGHGKYKLRIVFSQAS